jgi:hypothetical protein
VGVGTVTISLRLAAVLILGVTVAVITYRPLPSEVRARDGVPVDVDAYRPAIRAAFACAGIAKPLPARFRAYVVEGGPITLPDTRVVDATYYAGTHTAVIVAVPDIAPLLIHEAVHAAIGDTYHRDLVWGKGAYCGFPSR